ncbi:MAG: tetratricopeptide repeat protein [Treponema sp.]|nr:tetratricopeptide repeat protein [Treponema sp.]
MRAIKWFLVLATFTSCAGKPAVQSPSQFIPIVEAEDTYTVAQDAAGSEETRPITGRSPNIAEEIRDLVWKATPSSLLRALDLIRNHELSNGEFGRAMNAVSVYLLKTIYPDVKGTFPQTDPPKIGVYSIYMKILSDVGRGIYTPPTSSSANFLVYILPFLALLNDSNGDRMSVAVPDLQKAVSLNPSSPIAPYLLGFSYEKSGDLSAALDEYVKALAVSPECYPATQGSARIMTERGLYEDAAKALSTLLVSYPESMNIKKQLARVYFAMKDWSRAENAIAEILQWNNRDGEFLLMRAYVLVERGLFSQAQAPLDLYTSINPNNPEYLFLRARIQAEGYRNRDAALNYLRALSASFSVDESIVVYMAKLLIESPRDAEQLEGYAILDQLLKGESPSIAVMELAIADAIKRSAWDDARLYAGKLLEERRSPEDLLNAYTVEHGIGNNAAALSYAQELYEADPANEEACVAYISALMDTGRADEASRLINAKISSAPNGFAKAHYYYLRSKTRASDETKLGDLRSCLFEDPRNLKALIAMLEFYRGQRDDRRAIYYLKQALTISPDDPTLKQYEKDYAGQL